MYSPLNEEPHHKFVTDAILRGETNTWIAQNTSIKTSGDAVRRFRKRYGLQPSYRMQSVHEGVEMDRDKGSVTSGVKEGAVLDDPDTMLEERGLDPTEWLLDNVAVNEWDGPSQEGPVTYHQAKLYIKRKRPEVQILPARSDGWKAPRRKKPSNKKTELWVITGDQQAPFHDEALHEVFCSWLEQNKPDHGIALGDKVDFPDISRHRLDPENTATVNECIQAGYDIFRDYRTASLDTAWKLLEGNHDTRIRNILLDKVQPLYGVKRADTDEGDGATVLTLKHLLRLDELDIDFIDPEGPYDLGQINISDKLAVRHGWIARKGSGVSALATLEHLGYSIIVGHTHRQSLVYKTVHDIDGTPSTLTAAEAGCMCRTDQKAVKGRKFPDFTVLPDWQQGFSTVTTYSDGFFRIDNATFVNGTLLWRDERWTV